jgi:hypothetical protein
MFRLGAPILILTLLVLISACSSDSPQLPTPTLIPQQSTEVALGEAFTLAPGQLAGIAGEGVGMAFHRVAEDFRCPADSNCVTAGTAIAVLAISGLSDEPVQMEFIVPPGGTGQLQAGPYVVSLQSISPDPPSKDGVDAADYRVTLVVTKP